MRRLFFPTLLALGVLCAAATATATPVDASITGGVVVEERAGFTLGVDYDAMSWQFGAVTLGVRGTYVPVQNESLEQFTESAWEQWFHVLPNIGHRFDLVQGRIGLATHLGVGWWFQPSSYELEGGGSGPIDIDQEGGFTPTFLARADVGVAGPVFLGAEYTIPIGLPRRLEQLGPARNGLFVVSLRVVL